MAKREDPKRNVRVPDQYQLKFVGLKAGDEQPTVLLQAFDKNNRVIHSAKIDEEGNFALPAEVLKKSDQIVIGVSTEEGNIAAQGALRYRSSEFASSLSDGVFALAEGAWARLFYDWICVGGHVEVCRRRRWWFDSIVMAAASPRKELAISNEVLSQASTAKTTVGDLFRWPYRCYAVCLGTVEVYRKTCCCYPNVIEDWRVDGLVRDLEVIVAKLPKVRSPRFGPPPPPPPIDPFKTPIFEGGALNELALNAAYDLAALRRLPRDLASNYISQRPYLMKALCTCGRYTRVGSGNINPDGTFNICWREFRRLYSMYCSDQYAYVVKQTIGGVTTTIYDGRSAGIWFSLGDDAVLSSYNADAFTCSETGTAEGDAVVYLDLIGDTESHQLITPDATGWDRVVVPVNNSGLLFPGTGPTYERNMGGGLELTFFFPLAMRDPAIGAMYYRVSVTHADNAGNPTGPRFYYGDGLAWSKVVGLDVVPESLGPTSAGAGPNTQSNLYRIPYGDEPWTGSVRYHALINTLKPEFDVPDGLDLTSPSERHLITLEIFNAAGERLRPLGTPATGEPGIEVAKPFKFHRWFQASGSPGDDLKPVPFGALTHLFLWDNRSPVADVTRLVKSGVASSEECQFLEGSAASTFAIEYRSYVPDPRCLYAQDIVWVRGLNGSAANGGVGSLGTPSPATNVGQPPAPPANSGTETFEQMLTRLAPPNPPTVLPKCSFAVTLYTYSKTTNGAYLGYPQASETAAFALEISPSHIP